MKPYIFHGYTTAKPDRGGARMRARCIYFLSVVLPMIVIANSAVTAGASILSEVIRGEVEQIRVNEEHLVRGVRVGAVDLLADLYERRQFEPLWVDEQKIQKLISFVKNLDEEGLNPDDYHLTTLVQSEIDRSNRKRRDPLKEGHFDILLTDSLIRAAYHLSFGKVDPVSLNVGWNFTRDISNIDPAAFIQAGIDTGDIDGFLQQLIPDQPLYTQLKKALAEYRKIGESGGWAKIDTGETLKPGSSGPQIQQLRQRLVISGDYGEASIGSDVFDETLEQAVRKFQKRHGLSVDGIVGKQTMVELNRPVSVRIDQIRINLERMRWFLHDIPTTFLVVDIAGFHVYLVGDQHVLWDTKAMVGTPFRETPCFRAEIQYLVINPTWTIPPTILRKDTIPAIKKDPDYLVRKNISVLDRNGTILDRSIIDWSQYNVGNFPFVLRQEPGPDNALGLVKFIFPNPHFVFLHDTPSRSLFQRTERAFSSGCIRVDQPFALAERLLSDSTKWNQEKFQQIVDSGKTQTIFLTKPMSVLLLYWTAQAEKDGTVSFKRDIYNRDDAVLKGLDGHFKLHTNLSLSLR